MERNHERKPDMDLCKAWSRKLSRVIVQWKYVWIVLLAGVLLLLLGRDQTSAEAPHYTETEYTSAENSFSLPDFEERMTACLLQIAGIGRVQLMLSLDSSGREVYASDVRESGESSYESTISTVSDGSYGEQPVRVTTTGPEFRGAVVICDGAGDDGVRLAVTEAVASLCGLGTDRITVIQMQ